MVVFELSMPNCGSWNGKWSGEGRKYIRIRKNCQVPKEVIGKDFYYHLDDGWTACVSVSKVNCKESQKLERISAGFCGYEWMIESIIKNKEIKLRSEW